MASFLAALGWVQAADVASGDPIRVLLVTGGHDFEQPQFFQMFKDNHEITYQAVEHPKAHACFRPEAASTYDVIVLYDMWQPITEEAKADLVKVLKSGKGLVALHHCLASYQAWDEYYQIIGGRYFLEPRTEQGEKKPASTYQHDVRMKVQVTGADHPVTRGIKDFEILDEAYGGFGVLPGVKPLLTTTEPLSGPTICWAKNYGSARVVFLALGHDHHAYENASFRQLVAQAIHWTAGRK
jgi:uncharacterized protein